MYFLTTMQILYYLKFLLICGNILNRQSCLYVHSVRRFHFLIVFHCYTVLDGPCYHGFSCYVRYGMFLTITCPLSLPYCDASIFVIKSHFCHFCFYQIFKLLAQRICTNSSTVQYLVTYQLKIKSFMLEINLLSVFYLVILSSVNTKFCAVPVLGGPCYCNCKKIVSGYGSLCTVPVKNVCARYSYVLKTFSAIFLQN